MLIAQADDALDDVRRRSPGCCMAIDGLAISMSRVALLDTPLLFFVLLAFWFVLKDRDRTMTRIARDRGGALRRRPAAAVGAGAVEPPLDHRRRAPRSAPRARSSGRACGCSRGSGVYLVVTDALARRRAGVLVWPTDSAAAGRRDVRAARPVAFVVYLASWTGWLVTDGGYDRHAADANPATGLWSWVPLPLQSLWIDHVTMYNAAARNRDPARLPSPAWQWPFLIRPTAMYYHQDKLGQNGCEAADGCVADISSIPNPFIWYAAVIAVLVPRLPLHRGAGLALCARADRRRRDVRAVAVVPRAHHLPVLHAS